MTTTTGEGTTERKTSLGSLVVAWTIGLVIFVTLTIAQLVRQAGVPSWGTVWAEDGSVYYSQTRGLGNLFQGYAGYLQLYPRILGLTAHAFPIDDLSRYYAVAGAAVTTLAALAVWHFSSQLIDSRVLRAVLALNVPLIPALLYEQTANGVNSLWAVLFAGWWALLFHARRPRDTVLASVVVFVAATCSGLALLYIPVALWLLWRRRDLATRIVIAVFGAGILLQLAVIFTASDESPAAVSHLTDLPGIYTVRVLGSALVGERWLPDVWGALGWSLGVLGAALLIGAVAVLAVRSRGGRRGWGLLTIAYSVLLYVGPAYGRSTVGIRVQSDYHSITTRFTTISVWMLMSGLLIMFCGVKLRPATRQLVVILVVVQVGLVAAVGFRDTNPRSPGPAWRPAVAAARAACQPDSPLGLPRSRPLALPVVPPKFSVIVHCDDL